MQMTVDTDVMIPMRDGVHLSADIFRPAAPGQYPTLLYAPYTDKRTRNGMALMVNPITAAERGYVLIILDRRGTFRSEGKFSPFHKEGEDGYDTVMWAAAQGWCNGKVGSFGCSGMGITTMQTALAAPEPLKAVFLQLTGSDYYHGWAYTNGVFELGFALRWARTMAGYEIPRRPKGSPPPQAFLPSGEAAATLPLTDRRVMPYELVPWYFDEWLAHPDYDKHWKSVSGVYNVEKLKVPVLQVCGWYDLFAPGAFALNAALKRHPDAHVRENSRIQLGPWAHNAYLGYEPNNAGERNFGSTADPTGRSMTPLALNWFDQFLGVNPQARTPNRYFLMGPHKWTETESWPPRSMATEYYFGSGPKSANSSAGDGTLALASGAERISGFTYDPMNPVPTIGGNTLSQDLVKDGVQDQAVVEARPDILVYTSDILERDLVIAGEVRVKLRAATSVVDTDFTAKLVEVEATGYCANISEGILRLRYRHGQERQELATPGEVLDVEIWMNDVAHRFAKGGRLRLEISSSNFPRFARNLNCATHPNFAKAEEAMVAEQQVFEGGAAGSRLILPVID